MTSREKKKEASAKARGAPRRHWRIRAPACTVDKRSEHLTIRVGGCVQWKTAGSDGGEGWPTQLQDTSVTEQGAQLAGDLCERFKSPGERVLERRIFGSAIRVRVVLICAGESGERNQEQSSCRAEATGRGSASGREGASRRRGEQGGVADETGLRRQVEGRKR
eukprot:5921127-Pleurochrysis_carterae.AAC.1